MRHRALPLAALLSALSCSAPRPPATMTPAGEAPHFEGRLVHPAPLDPQREAFLTAAATQRDDVAPVLPPDAGVDTLREGFAPWLRRRAERLRELGALVPGLDQRSPDDALFAAVIYGTVADELREAVRALPPPPGLDVDATNLWRETRNAQVRPLLRHARDAWTRCVMVSPTASSALRPWTAVCTARVEALEALLRAEPPRARPRPERVTLPDACDGPEFRAPPVDPEAPPPVETAPRAIAVIYNDARFQGAALTRLLTPVRAWIARTPGARLVPQAEVEAARLLRTQRRWRAGGPVCGQSPPLPALLAVRNPNLVLATVETTCLDIEHPERDAGPERACDLTVHFRRAGTDDRTGLPPGRAVAMRGEPDDVEAWARAASSLGDPDAGASLSALIGGLGVSNRPVLRVLGYADIDPWLRVGPTLSGESPEGAAQAIEACVTRGGGVGVYAASWTVSPEGVAQEVSVNATVEPRDGSAARVSACVRDVLSHTGFPCPRSGAAAPAHARLCLGWM
jgi:hypothetical protein